MSPPRRMALDHELASMEGPEPTGLPADVLAKRRAWQAAWLHVQAMQHDYFRALNAFYNAGTFGGAELAASWYAASIQHLTSVVARRRADGLECELHLAELERLYTSARALDVALAVAPTADAAAYDNIADD